MGVQLMSSTSICYEEAMTDYSQVTSQHQSTLLSVASVGTSKREE